MNYVFKKNERNIVKNNDFLSIYLVWSDFGVKSLQAFEFLATNKYRCNVSKKALHLGLAQHC